MCVPAFVSLTDENQQLPLMHKRVTKEGRQESDTNRRGRVVLPRNGGEGLPMVDERKFQDDTC